MVAKPRFACLVQFASPGEFDFEATLIPKPGRWVYARIDFTTAATKRQDHATTNRYANHPSSIVINRHQPSSTVSNPSSTILGHHTSLALRLQRFLSSILKVLLCIRTSARRPRATRSSREQRDPRRIFSHRCCPATRATTPTSAQPAKSSRIRLFLRSAQQQPFLARAEPLRAIIWESIVGDPRQ